MSNSNFIDYVKFCSRSGLGGAGSVHFRREKHVPKGGPDGGDGGRGGSVVLRGNAQHWTLLHLKFRKHIVAEAGGNGEGNRRKGADGRDVVLDVPLGTVARDAETGEIRCEITEDGQEVVLTAGGRGGLGNDHFKTSTNQAPHYAQPGEEGIEEWIILELKLLGDVGLVGFPNAGKSTLLSVITAAKPKIDNYEFTTLKPNLGIVEYRNFQTFVVADIPGIIEGAAEGKGIGHRFLRHIERNSALLFLIPADAPDIREQYDILLDELRRYNPQLLDKDRLLAISKSDMLDDELKSEMKNILDKELKGIPYLFISSVAQQGLMELKDELWKILND